MSVITAHLYYCGELLDPHQFDQITIFGIRRISSSHGQIKQVVIWQFQELTKYIFFTLIETLIVIRHESLKHQIELK